MTKVKEHIFGKIAAIFLVVIITLPNISKLFHALEFHEHKVCTTSDIHFHEAQLDCDLCDYNFNPLSYNLLNYNYSVKKEFIAKPVISFTSLQFTSSYINIKQLRAPPTLI